MDFYMKVKEIRLLNTKIKQQGETIFEGKAEDIPDEIKEKQYKKIYFEGVDLVIEI